MHITTWSTTHILRSAGTGSRLRSWLVFACMAVAAGPAPAWSNHALCTWPALSVLPEVERAAPVKVESLDVFLAAEAIPLVRLLADEEAWARGHVPAYPPRPDALAFHPEGASPAELRRRFLAALRINPDSRLSLFKQVMPGRTAEGRPSLPEAEVTTLHHDDAARTNPFVGLREGEPVSVIDVVTAASDEPDQGLDIGLWDDNGTAAGKAYGFGKQPFGFNPTIEFSSQAPFHIGYFHESAIVYKAAPFLLKTYPEYRIHLWQSLAVHAMRSGHPYWGWRFTGWALHYLQDLTQPYHASVLPGIGVATMLWINTIDLVGFHAAKASAVMRVTNRHLALENFQFHRMRGAWLRHDVADAAWLALQDTSHDAGSTYTEASPRGSITQQSNALAATVDGTLERYLPARYVSDAGDVFGTTGAAFDLDAVVAKSGAPAQAAMTGMLAGLLGNFGVHTRSFVRSVLAASR